MAKDDKAPVTYDEVAANAEAKKTVTQTEPMNPEKVDAKTNQKLGDFLRTSDDAQMQAAIDRANREQRSGNADSRRFTADAMVAMSERDAELKAQAEEDLQAFEAANEPSNVQVPLEIWRARENARIKAEAAAKRIDETVPGGRYYEGGKWVNCDGKEIE